MLAVVANITSRGHNKPMEYRDFVVHFWAGEGLYDIEVTSPAGEGQGVFAIAMNLGSSARIKNPTVTGGSRHLVRPLPSPPSPPSPSRLREVGIELYNRLFAGEVASLFHESLSALPSLDHGLRIRLELDLRRSELAPLQELPWELLCRPETQEFLCLSRRTPVVRSLYAHRELRPPLPAATPLRILALAANPMDSQALELEREFRSLEVAWTGRQREVEIVLQKGAGLEELRRAFLAKPFQVLHFMGHGWFDEAASEGLIVLEDGLGTARPIAGRDLATELHDFEHLRLVVFNACQTARSVGELGPDPFAGVATAQVMSGVPMVIAMRRPIPDAAAVSFSRVLYERLALGDPVEAAVSEARLAILRLPCDADHWTTPVIFLRGHDGRLFGPVEEPHSPSSLQGAVVAILLAASVLGLALGWVQARGASEARPHSSEGIALLCVALASLIPLTVPKSLASRSRFLQWLQRRRAELVVVTPCLIVLAFGLILLKSQDKAPPFAAHSGLGVVETPVATSTAIELEIEKAAEEGKRAALAHFEAAKPLFEMRDYRHAIPEYRASIAALATQSAYLNLGIASRFTSDFKSATEALETGLKIARKGSDRQFEANFLLQLGAVAYTLGDRKKAEPYLKDAISLFRSVKDEAGEADALLSLAALNRVMGRPSAESAPLVAEAAKLYPPSNSLGLANVALYQGVDRLGAADCEGALKFFNTALARFTEIRHFAGQARARVSIGSCLSLLGKLAEAESELRAARDLAAESGQIDLQGAAILALAQVLSRERKFDDARQVAQEALKLGQQISAPSLLEYARLVLADADLNTMDLNGALSNADQALQISERTTDAAGRTNALCLKGRILLKRADPGGALSPLRLAVAEARKTSSLATHVECLRSLADALSATGKTRQGLEIRTEADGLARRSDSGH